MRQHPDKHPLSPPTHRDWNTDDRTVSIDEDKHARSRNARGTATEVERDGKGLSPGTVHQERSLQNKEHADVSGAFAPCQLKRLTRQETVFGIRAKKHLKWFGEFKKNINFASVILKTIFLP